MKTRFAPSPTGVLHLGSVRTALFCWLYARHTNGKFVLRIEDTDKARSTPENVEAITDGMAWLGLDADEGPYFQTDRFDRYEEILALWLAEGRAYRCYCSREELDARRQAQMDRGEKPRYDGRCRHAPEVRDDVNPVVRFKNPADGQVRVNDTVKGAVIFQNSELDDLIIARSDGSPTYNFTVVVDDYDMGITHVIRGDDHLNNTPRQMNMLSALGVEPPVYAHLPMILGPDGAKLSKRHGAVDIREYRALGYLPEAILNYLVRLGWSHGDKEVFSIDEMIELFDLDGLNQSASSFNPEKLEWINQQHMLAAPASRLAEMLGAVFRKRGVDVAEGPPLDGVVEAYRERASTLEKMADSASYCYEDFDEFDAKAAKKHLRGVILQPLSELKNVLSELGKWERAAINESIHSVAESHGINMGKLGQPLRIAVTGTGMSPSIDLTLVLVGKDRTLSRLDRAIHYIDKRMRDSES